MKLILVFLLVLGGSCFNYADDSSQKVMTKMQSLLINKLQASSDQISQINSFNGARFKKMHNLESEVGEIKTAILEEVFSRYPSEAKLDSLYGKLTSARELQLSIWVKTTRSIWKVLNVNASPRAMTQNKKHIDRVFGNHIR